MSVPVIGRDEERRVLAEALQGGGTVVLAGAAGVGKTRLARDASTAIGAARHVWISATGSGRDLPFAALAPLLSTLSAAPEAGIAVADPLGVAMAALAAVAGAPPLLVVDDAHLLDDASATLVHQIVGSRVAPVLLTVTSGRPAPDAVTAMWKDGWATRVELQPLARGETDELVGALLGAPCSPLLRHDIWETSQGNALVISELVHAARVHGAVRLVDGRFERVAALPLGARLAELVGARIAELSPAARGAAEIVAASEPVSLSVLEHLVEGDALAEVEERGIVVVDAARDGANGGDAVVRVMHPTYAELLRARTPASRRRAMARRLADAVEARGRHGRDDVLRVVTWRLDAGVAVPVEQLVDAAWYASEAFDAALAERCARAAVEGEPAHPLHHAAALALADALYRQGHHDEALAALPDSSAADGRGRAEVAVLRAKILMTVGRISDAQRTIDDVLAVTADREPAAWLRAFGATILVSQARFSDAIELAAPVADDASSGARATLTALSALAMAYAFCGRRVDALDAVERGRDPRLRAGTDLRTALSWALPATWVAHWTTGDLDGTESIARAFRDLGMQRRIPEWVGGGTVGMAWAAIGRGDIDGARRLLAEAAPSPALDHWFQPGTLGLGGVQVLAAAGAMLAAALGGDPEAGRAAARAVDNDVRGPRWFDAWCGIARAWVHLAEGDERGARGLLDDAARDARARGDAPAELHALHAAARIGGAREGVGRVVAVAEMMDGPFASLVARHCVALAEGRGDDLDAIARELAVLEMSLLAAECAAAAASAHDQQGAAASSEASRVRAASWLESCAGARPPTLAGWRLRPSLTRRELEVARLAALGRTTSEIAALLFVSVRTVDSHLAHIYTKLGIAGRHQLPEALGGEDAAQGPAR